MTALATQSPFPQYFDTSGSPLNAGRLYFGLTGQNPETSPTTVYWDTAGTQPAAQPIITSNGYTMRAGTPAVVYAAGDYSLTVKTSRGRMIYTAASSLEFSIAQQAANVVRSDALVSVVQPYAGAAARTQHDKNKDIVSITDFTGADPSGSASSAAAFASAEASVEDIYLPLGTYLAPSGTTLSRRYWGPGKLNYSGVGAVIFSGAGLNDVTFTGTFAQPQPLQVRIRIKNINVAGISGAASPCDTFEYSLNGGVTWIGTYDAYNPADDQVYALPLGLNANIGYTGTSVKVGIPGTGIVPVFAAATGHTIGDYWSIPMNPNRHSVETQSGYLTKGGVVFGGIGGSADNNTLLGRAVLGNLNNAGNQLTAIGAEALYANATGYANTAVGITALRSNVSGNNLTAVGANSLYNNTTGITNTAVGVYACNHNTTGSGNSGLGSDTNAYNATGNGNTAVGAQASYHNVSGTENAAVGLYALRGGSASLGNGTAQSYCTAMGAYSLYFGGGQFNVGVGHQAGYKNKSSQNVFVGAVSGAGPDITGGPNVFVGHMAGSNAAQMSAVTNCVVLGDNAYTTGKNAVCLGAGTIASENQIVIGNQFNVNIMTTGNITPRVDAGNNLGSSLARFATVFAASGAINTSDEREKQDQRVLDAAEKRVAVALKGLIRAFRFKDAVAKKGAGARVHVGVMAQQVVAAFAAEGLDAKRYGMLCYDEWVDDDGVTGGRYGVRYDELSMFILVSI